MIRWKDGSSWLVADQADRVDIQVIGTKKICFTAGGVRQHVETLHLWRFRCEIDDW